MPLTRTRTYMNWVNVTITPQGTSAIPVGSVTSVKPVRSSKLQKFHGDNYNFARVIKATERERGITIVTGDVAQLFQIPEDVPCTIGATLLDPRNGSAPGGGAIRVVLINAVMDKDDSQGENNKFASGTISFSAFGGEDSSGAEIDPMTVTYL